MIDHIPEESRIVKLLDHGFVRLVDAMGDDLSVVRGARVSYEAAWRTGNDVGSDHKLIRYLWRHHHSSPFENVELQFEVFAPIFVIRQWHRHRTQSYNELSGRYRELPEVFYVPEAENVGVQSKNNKQGRDLNPLSADNLFRGAQLALIERQRDHQAHGFALYRDLINFGWPKELARTHLGVATYSHMFAKMNLLNFFRFASLRDDPHAQMEIRVYAEAMVGLVRKVAPVCVEAWDEHRKWMAEVIAFWMEHHPDQAARWK